MNSSEYCDRGFVDAPSRTATKIIDIAVNSSPRLSDLAARLHSVQADVQRKELAAGKKSEDNE
jgi:hypothetical protein